MRGVSARAVVNNRNERLKYGPNVLGNAVRINPNQEVDSKPISTASGAGVVAWQGGGDEAKP
jgi:hypothetical protein